MTNEELAIIDEMQCPGCMCGGAPAAECEAFVPSTEFGFKCAGHSAGTLIVGLGYIYLGLPKGFNRVGAFQPKGDKETRNTVRLWIHPAQPEWDHLNVPVWAMEKDGFLYVRTYCPRINYNYVDVVKGGTMACIPPGCNAIDVAGFLEEID